MNYETVVCIARTFINSISMTSANSVNVPLILSRLNAYGQK